MIQIHFDILWTMIADNLYRLFAQDLKRFEKAIAPTIFKKFINMPGTVVYDGKNFVIKIRKRAYTPILKGVKNWKSHSKCHGLKINLLISYGLLKLGVIMAIYWAVIIGDYRIKDRKNIV